MIDPRAMLGALSAGGASRVDPEGAALAAGLLDRAEALGGAAAERLRARALACVESLAASLADARERAEAEMERLRGEGIAAPDAEALFAAADYAWAARAARRARLAAERERGNLASLWMERLGSLAVGSPATSSFPPPSSAAVAEASASHARFRQSAGSVRAALVVERAADDLPEGAGPYNGQVLAARALRTLADLSPGYVAALVASLDDLAALDALAAPAPAAGKKRSSPPRGSRKAPGR